MGQHFPVDRWSLVVLLELLKGIMQAVALVCKIDDGDETSDLSQRVETRNTTIRHEKSRSTTGEAYAHDDACRSHPYNAICKGLSPARFRSKTIIL